jgi:peptidoglycan hydrolase CwlO-like protein
LKCGPLPAADKLSVATEPASSVRLRSAFVHCQAVGAAVEHLSSYSSDPMSLEALRVALETSRPMIEEALSAAEAERDELQARCGELESLIARAKAALGETEANSPQIRYDRTLRYFARQSRRRAV